MSATGLGKRPCARPKVEILRGSEVASTRPLKASRWGVRRRIVHPIHRIRHGDRGVYMGRWQPLPVVDCAGGSDALFGAVARANVATAVERTEHPLNSRHLDSDRRKLLLGLLLGLRRHFADVAHLQARPHALERTGVVDHRREEPLVVEDSLTLEGDAEVMGDVFAERVREVRSADHLAHVVEIEPIVRLALKLDAQHAMRRTPTAAALAARARRHLLDLRGAGAALARLARPWVELLHGGLQPLVCGGRRRRPAPCRR
mmetsp:Transcript_49160/g.137705  ORF Transcript_49160/g.137705 Transcript_49160/m.137705 type:complete len:260 (-) Transcript_49160:55-834(-)